MSLSRRLIRIAQRRLADLADASSEPTDRSNARAELESYLSGPRYSLRQSPPSPPDPLQPYYETLGAPTGADLATVEKIWRRLVLENHPDRFMHNPEERDRASERLRRINAAHEVLERELRRREAEVR